MKYPVMDTVISPEGKLEVLSRTEVSKLLDKSQTGLYEVFRNCALAVLNCGNSLDDGQELLRRYPNFEVNIIQRERGIRLELRNAPVSAFVDEVMIKGIHEHLFAVLRDLLFSSDEAIVLSDAAVDDIVATTDFVFHVLRNADVLQRKQDPNMVVCWGGHSISRSEYDYTKKVGYELGLRGMDICTGCGPGAMKGPMKGATIGHAKQRITHGRYLGISEPGIIAAESPNPIVNNLVIMPDIEKRLEAFVRVGHAIVVFPGGAGTAEEILYLLGILLHPENQTLPFPFILTGPAESAAYFAQIHEFIGITLGVEAQERYQIIIDDPVQVAQTVQMGIAKVRAYRKAHSDAYYFNWRLKIEEAFQQPFIPTHEAMRSLNLHHRQEAHQLAANLRRAFSGIVAGNVKVNGIEAIERLGLFEIHGDKSIMEPMDALLSAFVAQGRMKLPGMQYRPCYRVFK